MALPTVDFRSFTIADIRECLGNAGYLTTDREFEIADDGAFKYIGYNNKGNHRYLLGFVDDDTDGEQYLVSRIFVDFDAASGTFHAEYSGMPEYQGTRDEIDEYIEKICN